MGVNKDSKVVVTYKAKLDDNAVVGSEGNPNTVYLKYANNPYQNGDGTNDTGKTPTDKNIVFTYKVLADKVDENGNALKGAKFELFKQNEDSTWKSLGEQAGTGTDENKFAWSGLDDGIYKLVENKVPDGYNKLDDQIFTVTGTHDSESDDPKLTDLTGNVTTGTITFDKNVTNGSLSTKVENRSGSLLPSTGGIGTTIFYVVGVVLMLGAGVLLITKRRMSAKH